MSEKKFTFVELHLEGSQFGPSTITDALPFGDVGTGLEDDTETEPAVEETAADLADDEESESKGKAAVGAVVALAVLVAIGVAVRKFRGDDEEEVALEEEPEVIVN